MFRHDMADFQGGLPAPDATYRSDRLRSAFEHADWAPTCSPAATGPWASRSCARCPARRAC
ncbi:hypothetical protein ACFQYP_23610 [Nonomuraea antimicrobica]